MKWLLIFFIFLFPTIIFGAEDSILNCERFEASWWNPFSWFDDMRSELYDECQFILNNQNLDIHNKKLRILELYNPNEHMFDYTFVDTWNEDLEINLSENVEGVEKHNSTIIKNAYFVFSALNPSVKLQEKENFLVIPNNPNLKVDYGFETILPEDQEADEFPDFTLKGFCEEEYELVESTGKFDLFIDKTKQIGEDLGKEIDLNLTEQGSHSIDGLYDVKVSIKGTYHQWRKFCDDWGEGGCLSWDYACDEFYKSEIIADQIILTDFKEVAIEQPVMDILNTTIEGLNENLTAKVTIEGLDTLQKYNFNNWYVMTNYISRINYLYPPINYLQLEGIKQTEPRYEDMFLDKEDNTFIFSTTPANKNLTFKYNGFFFNNTININLSYKNFTYPDLVFDDLWYNDGDNITIYPYLFREKNRCENCSVLLDKVRIMYDETNEEIITNEYGLKSSVSFIYKEEEDCVTIYYEGDENHYPSKKCVDIPDRPSTISYLIWFYWFAVGVAILTIIAKFALRPIKK